jgi:hypothetical protein
MSEHGSLPVFPAGMQCIELFYSQGVHMSRFFNTYIVACYGCATNNLWILDHLNRFIR